MATRKRDTRKVIAHNSTYIDPLNCDSKISYKIIDASNRLWGSVDLTDCEHKISWWFSKEEPLTKLDKAIEMLTEFRSQLIEAQAVRLKRVRAARKTAVKK